MQISLELNTLPPLTLDDQPKWATVPTGRIIRTHSTGRTILSGPQKLSSCERPMAVGLSPVVAQGRRRTARVQQAAATRRKGRAAHPFVAISLLSALLVTAVGGLAATVSVIEHPEVYYQDAAPPVSRVIRSGFALSSFMNSYARDRAYVKEQVSYVANIIRASNPRQRNALKLAELVVAISADLEYDPIFVAAVMKHESTFNPVAISNKGALGLMQVMPRTGEYVAKKIGLQSVSRRDLTTPEYNIYLGVSYLKQLERIFQGNRRLALIAYNWGPTKLRNALSRRSSIPSGPEKYASRILRDHTRWARHFKDTLDPDLRHIA